jgi:hypothetical protein
MPDAPSRSRPPAAATFDDLAGDLVWPRLLKAGALALRPARLGLAFFFLLGISLVASIGTGIAGTPASGAASFTTKVGAIGGAFVGAGRAAGYADADEAARQLYRGLIVLPGELVRAHPLATLVCFPLAIVLFTLVGAAISRTAATEVGLGAWLEWPKAVGFALSRWGTLAAAAVVPLVVGWMVCLGLAAGGWALFSAGWSGVLGGAVWILFLIGAGIAALILLAYVFGHPLLVPAVACESADALDAVQHAYALVFARPLRLVVYAAILIAQALIVGIIVAIVVAFIQRVAEGAASVWASDRGAAVIMGSPLVVGPAGTRAVVAPDTTAAWLVRFWTIIPTGLAAAFFVSYYWCASTLLFLGLRRVADGQDFSEIWMPGMVEGTMAEALSGRSAAVVPPASARAGEAIADNGPADET